jgi:hypothetical protein
MQVTTERWKKLCEEAAIEQDPQRLIELITEINCLLEKKQSQPNDKKAQ